MANGFIDGVGYPMNGGLSAGFAYGQKLAEEKRRQGLASGVSGYINAKDENEKKAYFAQIAQNDPKAALDIYNKEQEIARQDRLTPYQQEMLARQDRQFDWEKETYGQMTPYQEQSLALQRQGLERQGQITPYQQAQIERQNKLDQLALDEKAQANEKETALGDALFRYQTAQTEEEQNAALADVYRISPDFAKDIFKKKKEEEKAWTTDTGRLWSIYNNPNEKPENRKLAGDMLMAQAQNPLYKGQIAYNSALGKQYAEAGMPYGIVGQAEQDL